VAKGTVHRAAAAQDRGSLPYGDTMLELISIIAGLAVCILIPIELGKIRKGWVHKKFTGDRPRFLAAYRKQLRMLMWLGLVFAVLGLGLAALEARHGEAIVKVVGAVIWLTVSGLSFNALRELAKVPDTEPSTLPPR
jgi:predicted Na+-dependent transporter